MALAVCGQFMRAVAGVLPTSLRQLCDKSKDPYIGSWESL